MSLSFPLFMLPLPSSFSYKELLRDEKSLCSEIQALGKRFESWENQNTTFAHSVIHPKIPAANDMPREVSDFEVMIITRQVTRAMYHVFFKP